MVFWYGISNSCVCSDSGVGTSNKQCTHAICMYLDMMRPCMHYAMLICNRRYGMFNKQIRTLVGSGSAQISRIRVNQTLARQPRLCRTCACMCTRICVINQWERNTRSRGEQLKRITNGVQITCGRRAKAGFDAPHTHAHTHSKSIPHLAPSPPRIGQIVKYVGTHIHAVVVVSLNLKSAVGAGSRTHTKLTHDIYSTLMYSVLYICSVAKVRRSAR